MQGVLWGVLKGVILVKNRNKIVVICAAILLFNLAGLGLLGLIGSGGDEEEDHTGEAMTPADSSEMKGLSYEDVEQQFANAGFTNIQFEEIDDLITGFMTKEGEVEEVSVGGDVNYDSGEWMPAETKVIIRYHVFPEDSEASGSDDSTEGEEMGDDETGSEEKSDAEFGEDGAEMEVIDTENMESVENLDAENTEDAVLTVDNCEELAGILSLKAEIDETYIDFAAKYAGQTIEFDGRVDALANHGNYDTRYDILVSAGDYDPDTQTGPTFMFENVNAGQLGLDTLFMEEEISVGKNVRITAQVDSFDENTGIFRLNPILVTDR